MYIDVHCLDTGPNTKKNPTYVTYGMSGIIDANTLSTTCSLDHLLETCLICS